MAQTKGILIERLQSLGLGKPEFKTKRSGPAHAPTFTCEVFIDDKPHGSGQGNTKREAERQAARETLALLEKQPPPASEDATSPPDVEAFEGPWPIFEQVLAASLSIANDRLDRKLHGDDALTAIRTLALTLYKETLEDLGEVVEVENEELQDPD